MVIRTTEAKFSSSTAVHARDPAADAAKGFHLALDYFHGDEMAHTDPLISTVSTYMLKITL